jgi:hypothetical protein
MLAFRVGAERISCLCFALVIDLSLLLLTLLVASVAGYRRSDDAYPATSA